MLKESMKCPPTAVAQVLVHLVLNCVPVYLLNTRSEPVTIYAGMEVATLEQAEVPSASIQAVAGRRETPIHAGKLEVLSNLVKNTGPTYVF